MLSKINLWIITIVLIASWSGVALAIGPKKICKEINCKEETCTAPGSIPTKITLKESFKTQIDPALMRKFLQLVGCRTPELSQKPDPPHSPRTFTFEGTVTIGVEPASYGTQDKELHPVGCSQEIPVSGILTYQKFTAHGDRVTFSYDLHQVSFDGDFYSNRDVNFKVEDQKTDASVIEYPNF